MALSPREQDKLANHLESLVDEERQGKRYLCWAPGTSSAIVMAYQAAEKAAGMNGGGVGIKANQFLGLGKWNRVASDALFHGSQGNPVTLTWSIVPDNTLVASRSGENAPSNFRSWMSGIYGGSANGAPADQPWFEIIQEAIESMGEQCAITFVYEPEDDGTTMTSSFSGTGRIGFRGDIRIGARFIDGSGDLGSGGSVLAFAFAPDYGDIVFDSGDPFFDNISNNSIRFKNVMAHELGHSLGLAHVCPVNRTKLMEPTVTTSFRGPQFDETYSLQRQYGDPWELLGTGTNNDFTGTASPLNLVDDKSKLIRWVSIDGSEDRDFYRFPVQDFQKINVVLSPQSASYLEGPQLSTGCTSGTTFSPGIQQNLSLEIIGPDGSTVLASSTDAPIGEGESILDYEFENAGLHYIRVTGDGNDSAQLYSLTVLLGGAPPAPRIVLGSYDLVAESGSVKNGWPDPGETISVDLSLLNIGTKKSDKLTVSLTIPEGVSSSANELTFSDPEPGTTTSENLSFSFTGHCGQRYEIPGIINDSSGEQSRFTLHYQLGLLEEGAPYLEDFDTSNKIPEGWTQSTTGEGLPWRIVTDPNWSPPNSIFSPAVAGVSTSTLTSPSIALGAANNVLKFAHFYDFESDWDGAVLEASLGNGDWFDLPTHPSVNVEAGGYQDRSIFSLSGNPLRGRPAWTGSNGGLTLTEFILPDDWGNQDIRFRWLMGHDRSEARTGWYLDRFSLERDIGVCEPHRPLVTLSAQGDNRLEEGNAETSSLLTARIELPISVKLDIPLTISGTAEASDLSGDLMLTIPAGSTSVATTLNASSDELEEGPETLTISLPEDAPSFAAADGSSQTFTLIESTGFSAWAAANLPAGAAATDDSDSDGWSNLGEYFLDTNPADPLSRPSFEMTLLPEHLEIPLSGLPERNDGSFTIETSSDLETWLPAAVEHLPEALRIPRNDTQRYLRFTFSFEE
ncbi:MAG: matrixin family metalloprotease [Akkermansiaceae bacterium]